MSGGKDAQIAFYYQNIITILRVLDSLTAGTLVSAKIEQKVLGSGKEIDIILEQQQGKIEYYEVKSGQEYTGSETEISISIKSLFENYKRDTSSRNSSYTIMIMKNYLPPISKITADFRKFKTHKHATKNLKKYCKKWSIPDTDISEFHEFNKLLTIDQELGVDTAKAVIIDKINKIREGVYANAEHAITQMDLLNRLLESLMIALAKNNGVINLQDFVGRIVDWCVRNTISAQAHTEQSHLDTTKNEVCSKLQTKFPTVAIIEIPSTSAAISET